METPFILTQELLDKIKEYPKITNSIVKVLIPNYEDYRISTAFTKVSDYLPDNSEALECALRCNNIISKRSFLDNIENALDSIDDESDILINISENYVEIYSTEVGFKTETNSEILSRLAKILRLAKKENIIKEVTNKFNLDEVLPKDISKDDITALISKLQLLQAEKN